MSYGYLDPNWRTSRHSRIAMILYRQVLQQTRGFSHLLYEQIVHLELLDRAELFKFLSVENGEITDD